MGISLEAFEVQRWDADGKSITKKDWYPNLETARNAAMKVDRTHGPGTARILKLEWLGVDSDVSYDNPLSCVEVSVIDTNDPEVREFIRLSEKFKGLRIPIQTIKDE